MPNQAAQLELDRCPHCNRAMPTLQGVGEGDTKDHGGDHPRHWKLYRCSSCGGVTLTIAPGGKAGGAISEMYPPPQTVDEAVPTRARDFLFQAIESLHAPAGAVMLTASAVDAMLKDKGYKDGQLFNRINQARDDHLITKEMALWAHEIRLEANDQRHADEDAPLPNEVDANNVIEFAKALAEFLYVLPARVARGRGGDA